MARGTQRARRMLAAAAPHVGVDVVVLAPGVNGAGYMATSMSTKSSADVEKVLTLVSEARKKLLALQRMRRRDEARLHAAEMEA